MYKILIFIAALAAFVVGNLLKGSAGTEYSVFSLDNISRVGLFFAAVIIVYALIAFLISKKKQK